MASVLDMVVKMDFPQEALDAIMAAFKRADDRLASAELEILRLKSEILDLHRAMRIGQFSDELKSLNAARSGKTQPRGEWDIDQTSAIEDYAEYVRFSDGPESSPDRFKSSGREADDVVQPDAVVAGQSSSMHGTRHDV